MCIDAFEHDSNYKKDKHVNKNSIYFLFYVKQTVIKIIAFNQINTKFDQNH